MRVKPILYLMDINSDRDDNFYSMPMDQDKSYYSFTKYNTGFKYDFSSNLILNIPLNHKLGFEYNQYFAPDLELEKYLPNFKSNSNMNFVQKMFDEVTEENIGLNYDFPSKLMSAINVKQNYFDVNNELYINDKNDEIT